MSFTSSPEERDWFHKPEGDDPNRENPIWYDVTLGSAAYAVRARHADEAITKAESLYGGPAFIWFANIAGEENSAYFKEKYADREVVRTIPFSLVEWPADPSHMTDEQRAAFDALKTPAGGTEE